MATNEWAQKGEATLTVRDVCAELRLSRNTVYGLIASGQLAAFRVGKQRYRVEPADLRRYKEARRAAQTRAVVE
jgi:excisionase family DNA binding protein